MKVCRTCHSAFPDGYQNCPKDGSRLEQQMLFGHQQTAREGSSKMIFIVAGVAGIAFVFVMAIALLTAFFLLRQPSNAGPEAEAERLVTLPTVDNAEPVEEDDAGKPDESRKGEPTDKRPEQISGGVLNGKAKKLPKPDYSPAAKAVKAEGLVTVQVLVDTKGKVAFATAVSGHPLLRPAAVKAAKAAEFAPTTLSGKPVEVSGVLTYNFVAPD
ncbi:MAG TPA: TonB family protein [Pyrinomonadaceae bacterium]|nr:TonB family protein [Pyrinomonadaceae bacterium]HMP64433.1 TonB family protein [Pyrinomonadaceae bacterium]